MAPLPATAVAWLQQNPQIAPSTAINALYCYWCLRNIGVPGLSPVQVLAGLSTGHADAQLAAWHATMRQHSIEPATQAVLLATFIDALQVRPDWQPTAFLFDAFGTPVAQQTIAQTQEAAAASELTARVTETTVTPAVAAAAQAQPIPTAQLAMPAPAIAFAAGETALAQLAERVAAGPLEDPEAVLRAAKVLNDADTNPLSLVPPPIADAPDAYKPGQIVSYELGTDTLQAVVSYVNNAHVDFVTADGRVFRQVAQQYTRPLAFSDFTGYDVPYEVPAPVSKAVESHMGRHDAVTDEITVLQEILRQPVTLPVTGDPVVLGVDVVGTPEGPRLSVCVIDPKTDELFNETQVTEPQPDKLTTTVDLPEGVVEFSVSLAWPKKRVTKPRTVAAPKKRAPRKKAP